MSFTGSRDMIALDQEIAALKAQRDQLLAALKEADEILQAWGDWVNEGDMVAEHANETGISEDRVAKAFDQIRDAIRAAEGADHA